jgi:hypothetical protein
MQSCITAGLKFTMKNKEHEYGEVAKYKPNEKEVTLWHFLEKENLLNPSYILLFC